MCVGRERGVGVNDSGVDGRGGTGRTCIKPPQPHPCPHLTPSPTLLNRPLGLVTQVRQLAQSVSVNPPDTEAVQAVQEYLSANEDRMCHVVVLEFCDLGSLLSSLRNKVWGMKGLYLSAHPGLGRRPGFTPTHIHTSIHPSIRPSSKFRERLMAFHTVHKGHVALRAWESCTPFKG
eukprot:353763-Chlamydomonas_euryale.AAC.3